MSAQVIEQLQDASWRGIKFPFTGTRDFGFQHEQAPHRYIFRDQQLIESLGRGNPIIRFRIPFYEGIRQHGWTALFTQVYPKFLAACLDRSAGELYDPVHTSIRAKCVSLAESLSTSNLDGVEVSAEFIYAPEDDSQELTSGFSTIASTLTGLQASAVEYGAAVDNLSAETKAEIAAWYADKGRAEISVLQVGRVFTSTAQQYRDRTRAQLANVTYEMEQTREELEDVTNPDLEYMRRSSSRFARSSRELTTAATDPTKPFRAVRTTYEIGRMALATFYQITVEQLLEFNPSLVNMMTVPANFPLKIPKKDG